MRVKFCGSVFSSCLNHNVNFMVLIDEKSEVHHNRLDKSSRDHKSWVSYFSQTEIRMTSLDVVCCPLINCLQSSLFDVAPPMKLGLGPSAPFMFGYNMNMSF